jgi:hypothetical protein
MFKDKFTAIATAAKKLLLDARQKRMEEEEEEDRRARAGGGGSGSGGGGGSGGSSSSSSSSTKHGTDPDEIVEYSIPKFQNFEDFQAFGVERFGRVQIVLPQGDSRTTYLVIDETKSVRLILLQLPVTPAAAAAAAAAKRRASLTTADDDGSGFNPVPAACCVPGGLVKTRTFWVGGFCSPGPARSLPKHAQGTEFFFKTKATDLILLPRFNGFACVLINISKAPDSLKARFKPEHRSGSVKCTYVSGLYAKGVSAVVPAEEAAELHKVVENAFTFELEVVDISLLANREDRTISGVPETCIESIVRVGDRFYDLNNGMRTGVVVSFPSENLAGVIFDIDKSFHVFPAFLFGNRFVYVRTTAFFI